ncbi:MAG: hypothetical protein DHS20C21_24350 [Gemmatimonadota bacterium]|nr:MAG: hypothetical protein DHS20C21_24350 [Gemmatimonadota bacterium]
MRWNSPTVRLSLCVLASCWLLPGSGLANPEEEEVATPPVPCSAPEFSQFDFWVGEWDLTWANDGQGTNVIAREYDGCVIREQFSTEGFQGTSVSCWSPKLGKWRQTWVDNSGSYLDFTGGMVGDRMILSREVPEIPGTTHQRMVFHDITADSLIWDWESSKDGGETWTTNWQIHYQRRAGTS